MSRIINNNKSVLMYNLRQIPSDCQIKRLVRKILFGSHIKCPRCNSRQVYKSENRYRCKKCRRPFSLTSNTWLNNMKFSWQRFYLLLWCWLNHLPIQQTMKVTELSEPTTRKWFDKFRLYVPDNYYLNPLKDTVQMDEAFFKKSSVIAAKDVKAKKIVLRVLPRTNVQKQNIAQFIVRHVQPGSNLYTDGGGYYKAIQNWWPVKHKHEVHSKWEFTLTSEIEGIFGNLRTFIRRKYHHVTCSKLASVVAEFQANFNHPEIFESPTKYLEKSLIIVPTC